MNKPRVILGDSIGVMRRMPEASIDAIVTDPPYGLGFMGKAWDDLPPGEEWARECLRVLKPGGHLLAFGGTRTWHRLAVAVEDAGFEIRDSIAWMSGSGFPKSRNVSRDLDIIRCRCDMGELQHGATEGNHPLEQGSATDLPIMRSGVLPISDEAPRGSSPGVLAEVQGNPRPGPIGGNGSARRADATGTGWPEGAGQPGMEGWRDVQATEGELHRSAIRQVPAGTDDDGTVGRLRDGAPTGDGAVDRAPAAAVRGGQPQGSRPPEQRAVKPGAIPDERGSQARGGWPVCGGCGKPVVPDGLGTALKPAHEPITVARKPLQGTVAANVQRYGTGAMNIDGCRVGYRSESDQDSARPQGQATALNGALAGKAQSCQSGTPTTDSSTTAPTTGTSATSPMGFAPNAAGSQRKAFTPNQSDLGRWPANVVLDSDQAAALDAQPGGRSFNPAGKFGKQRVDQPTNTSAPFAVRKAGDGIFGYGDQGGASRFFYVTREEPCKVHEIKRCTICLVPERDIDNMGERFKYCAKAPKNERPVVNGVAHPTVKPLSLMRWLVRLVTPTGGTVLDPFAGSGTTIEAAMLEGFSVIGIEREAEYLPLIGARIKRCQQEPA